MNTNPLPLTINRNMTAVFTYEQVPGWSLSGHPGRLLRDANGHWWKLRAYSAHDAVYMAVTQEPTHDQIEANQ